MRRIFKRYGLLLSLVLLTALAAGNWSAANAAETFVTADQGFDRPGNDYKNFDLPSANPSLCSSACYQDFQCAAYAYVKPGVQGPSARCWLKTKSSKRVANGCCTSGAKVTFSDAYNFTVEFNRDRGGNDYRSFDLVAPSVGICIQQCKADSRCVAYTFVAPGVQNDKARCWLKETVPALSVNSCCISGKKLP